MYLQVRQLLVQIVLAVVVARPVGRYVSYYAAANASSGSLLGGGRFVRQLLLGGVRRLYAPVRVHVRADRAVRRGRHVPVHHGGRVVRVEPIDRATLPGRNHVLAHLVVLPLQVAARARHQRGGRRVAAAHLRHPHRHRDGRFAVLARRVRRVGAVVHLILAEIGLRVAGMVCRLPEIVPGVRVLRVMLVVLVVSLAAAATAASHRTGHSRSPAGHHLGARRQVRRLLDGWTTAGPTHHLLRLVHTCEILPH
uniref:Secreted protein n=1 Tax=Anopheles merus TaxID=30066 RepID=A0A182V063_ANOME